MNAFPSALLLQARDTSQQMGEPFLVVLQRLANVSSDELLTHAASQSGIPYLSLADIDVLIPDFTTLPYADCLRQQGVLFIEKNGQRLFVTGDPFDETQHTWASYRIPGNFRLAFIHPLELRVLLSRLEVHQQAMTQLVSLNDAGGAVEGAEDITLKSIVEGESQVVRLVNSALYDAHKVGASDIHLENIPRGLIIKYRIDGVLSRARELADVALAEQVISRIKVMAELDIGEKRVPQDGRFAVAINSREVDFRVSVMPGLFGEDVVLRILDKQAITTELSTLSLDLLGFDATTRDKIRRLALQPYGMLLVTGPTGSGKTTSLYATLSEINHGDDKIITIEDPVEYQLAGVLQIPVNEKKGLTFAKGLRSILRHDPDRILVGEIRDKETAEIAVQAALTGHLVFTSVHANNAFDVISRFRHMGVDAYSFIAALNGIVAQRLVRLICLNCAAEMIPSQEELSVSGMAAVNLADFRFMHGSGCVECRGTGYKGRRALAEVLMITDEMRELMLQQAPVSQLKKLARHQGMSFLREQAVDAVRAGQTTLQEINRVTVLE